MEFIGDQDTLVNLGFLPKDIYQQAKTRRTVILLLLCKKLKKNGVETQMGGY